MSLKKKAGVSQLGWLVGLLLLLSSLLAACGDATATAVPATAAPVATTVAATTVAATTAAMTTAVATTAAPTTVATTTAAPTTSAAGGTTAATGSGTATGTVVVYAASSLTDTFNQIKAAVEKANPGLTITLNYNGSNTLRAQLEQGAKADVFASANQTEIDNALKSNLIADHGTVFAKNRLVVILPKDNPGKITTLQDLAKPGVKFVTAQKDVPVGGYTLTALDKMSKDASFGSDFSSKVQGNFVSQETNVKQVVAKVQLGEADAGICYLTDISPSVAGQVTTLAIPDQFNTLASYPLSVLKGASNSAGAKVFYDFVVGPQGQAILKANGFLPAS